MDAIENTQGFKTFVLDDEEYYGLHKYIPKVSEENLKNSSSFANPETKEAYILRSGCKESDEEVLTNGYSELLNERSPENKQDIMWGPRKESRDMANLKFFSHSQREKLKEFAKLDIADIAQQAHVSNEDAQIFKDFISKE